MGHDQRDVPLNLVLSRSFAFSLFCLFALSPFRLSAQPVKCGFLSESERIRVDKLAEGIQADRSRPVLTDYRDDADGLFRVHYTLEGSDAIPTADQNGNGTPDYVEYTFDALHRSWKLFTDTLENVTVPRDGTNGGSNAIDVYLYGETVPETMVSSVNFPRYTSWMQLDNNFSPDDRNIYGEPVFATFGLEGLQITCAHELHHVVQIGAHGDAAVQLMAYEMTSTWMEQRAYPHIRDWIVYAANLFTEPGIFPFSEPRANNGYVWGFFPNVYRARVGDALIGSMWSKIGDGIRPFNALVEAGHDLGYPLDSAFTTLLPELYHTGSRAEDTSVILPGAEELPEIRLIVDDVATEPSTMQSGNLRPFEVRALRYQVPSVTDGNFVSTGIVITWADMSAFVQTEMQRLQAYTVTLTPNPVDGDIPISGSLWGVRVQGPNIIAFIEGAAYDAVPAPYPQPLVLGTTTEVRIPVNNAKVGDQATVSLMTIQGLGVVKETVDLIFDASRLVAPLNVPHDLTPGTYLVNIECNGQQSLHKILVKR
jgi:hypothetical protein